METKEATILAAHIRGLTAFLCRVTATLEGGLLGFTIVGLSEAAVREVRVRVRASLVSAGFEFPVCNVTVTIDPAAGKDGNTNFDLSIALALLVAMGRIAPQSLDSVAALAELSLGGVCRPVRGALLAAELFRAEGFATVLVAPENGPEAELAGLPVRRVSNLQDVVAWLGGSDSAAPLSTSAASTVDDRMPDMADLRGQPFARRVVELAAAGGHNLMLVGPPGVGKTMLARRLPGVLPPMTTEERLEVTRVASIAGLNIGGGAVHRRPFRAPHHSTTAAGIVGGGVPGRPGELSLAHKGVLFLDELNEFSKPALEYLAQPLRDRTVELVRANGTLSFPADAQVVAALNPCPCGRKGSGRECRCSKENIEWHRRRAAILDPCFDVTVQLPPVDLSALTDAPAGEPSRLIAARVVVARKRQLARQGKLNAALEPHEVVARGVDEGAVAILQRADKSMTTRGAKLFRVARTIADLEGTAAIEVTHAAEALNLAALA